MKFNRPKEIDKNKLKEDIDLKIKNRTNKFILLLLSLVVITGLVKFLISDINLASLELSDILSVLLAFFSIGISVLFFFKASDTSNRFYDNTYHFTKDISEKLGRIEERFGEKLDTINEDNKRQMKYILDSKMVLDEVDQEKEELKTKQAERNKLIDDLIEKSKLQEEEKESFKSNLNRYEEEIYNSLGRIKSLNSELPGSFVELRNGMFRVTDQLRHEIMNMKEYIGLLHGYRSIYKGEMKESYVIAANTLINKLSPLSRFELMNLGVLDDHYNMKENGFDMFIDLIRSIDFE